MLVIKSLATINYLFTNILQSIFFCVQQKKETHVDVERFLRVSKWWQFLFLGKLSLLAMFLTIICWHPIRNLWLYLSHCW